MKIVFETEIWGDDSHLYDTELSFAAKGLMSSLMEPVEGTDVGKSITVDHHFHEKYIDLFKELVNSGFLTCVDEVDENGKSILEAEDE